MLTRRIIPCLDVRDGVVVKGVKFKNHQVMGDAVDLARRYRDQGADELVFYDIAASSRGETVSADWVREVARHLDIPFCVAGGIRTVDQARAILHAGADKISINSPALERPELVDDLARVFGSQCVVVGVDSRKQPDGTLVTWKYTGSEATMQESGRSTLEWVREVVERGAGEIVLNCMGADGTKAGYDCEQLEAVRGVCSVPLIASGGAGSVEHFRRAFAEVGVEGALAAGIFHRGELSIPELKRELARQNIRVRL